MRARESTLAVPGATLFIVEVADDLERVEQAGAAPIVILHGGPAASHDYLRPQLDHLAAGRRVVYYDQRGGGRSPADPTPPSSPSGGWPDHVADLERLRLHLGLPQLRLLGYSWGGLLALLYALEHPRSVEKLALMSPAPVFEAGRAAMQENLRRAGQRPEVDALRASLDLPSLDGDQARRARFALAVAGYFQDPRLALTLSPFRIQARAEQAVWRSLAGYDLRPRLPSLSAIPSLVVHGRQDPLPVEGARETAALLGAAFVPLEACGHVPYVEAPGPLFAALDPFFA